MNDDVIRTRPLGLVIADALRRDIVAGRLAGDQELRQDQLAQRFGTSRIPVREAIQVLQHEGLVEILPNRRSVVVGLDNPDIEDHYRVRALIESQAAAQCAEQRPDVGPLREIQTALEQATTGQDAQAHVTLNREFHEWVWKQSGSRWLVVLARNLWQGVGPHTPGVVPSQPDHSRREHRAVIKAIEAADPEQARQAMSGHVLRSCAALLEHRAAWTSEASDR